MKEVRFSPTLCSARMEAKKELSNSMMIFPELEEGLLRGKVCTKGMTLIALPSTKAVVSAKKERVKEAVRYFERNWR